MVADPFPSAPLLDIERQVLGRARDLRLEPGTELGAIRAMVTEAVEAWTADHDRGVRPTGIADPGTLIDRAVRNLTGYGPLAPLLADEDVWEIMINAPSEIFVKRHLGHDGYHDEVFHDDAHVERTLTKLLNDASTAHRTLDAAEGLQDAQLDDGSRLHIVHRDIGRGGHLIVNIRRFTAVAFRRLDQLVERSMLSAPAARLLAACVRARTTIVFAGSPGSGKTTLLSCCCAELDPALRVVVAEEVFEADVPVANVAHLQTRPPRSDRPAIDLRRLVSGFLRMAPDVAIVGEVRDREALPLLLTLSSGVKGFTTIHAGSARQALTRLRFICQISGGDLPMAALNSLICDAVDLVVHTERTPGGPRITEILAIEDAATAADAPSFTATSILRREPGHLDATWTGEVPIRLRHHLAAAGIDLGHLLQEEPPAHRPPGMERAS